MERILTRDVWWGSYYELALELGPRSDRSLIAAVNRLWRHEALDGPYPDHAREPHEQEKIAPVDTFSGEGVVGYGVATVPGGRRLACATNAVREEGDGPDWLELYIPMPELETVYPVFAKGSPASWADPLDEWFADIGRFVHAMAPIALGLVGEETSGAYYASHIAERGVPERHCGMLIPSGDGELRWLPATR